MFPASYFPKTYFVGTYFPPIAITSLACQLARVVLIAHGWQTSEARHYLVTRAVQRRRGQSGGRWLHPLERHASAKLFTEAALCLDPTIDSWALEMLVQDLRVSSP